MSYSTHTESKAGWSTNGKMLFRFLFVFLLLLALPFWDIHFYSRLFSSSWNVHDILELTHYSPGIISAGKLPKSGLPGFMNWGILFIIAVIATGVWSYFDRDRKEYRTLYYWLRTILRYRIAISLAVYGLIKLFPLQIPFPTLSNLNTRYGDFQAWKLYYQTLGIAPAYESFLGFVEILAALLLFFRKTATFGAGLVLGFTGNVLMVNIFYDIGEHVYSASLLLMALFVFSYDTPRLYQLLFKGKKALANTFKPVPASARLRNVQSALKLSFVLFIAAFALTAYTDYKNGPFLLPKDPGLSGAYGFYNVKYFVLNHDTIPYSLTDTSRWQNVVFEKWSTLSVNINRPVKVDQTNGDGWYKNDIDRDYELAGTSGRHYFHYDADTVRNTLILQNKNKNHSGENYSFSYSRPDSTTIILQGHDERSDSLDIVLERVNKKYMLLEGRRKPVKL